MKYSTTAVHVNLFIRLDTLQNFSYVTSYVEAAGTCLLPRIHSAHFRGRDQGSGQREYVNNSKKNEYIAKVIKKLQKNIVSIDNVG